jgi:protein-glutamine gamma-glutamyltransferase
MVDVGIFHFLATTPVSFMPLNRLLQIVVAALAAMGTMLLGMGQREIGMTMLMVLAAGLSVWLTDVKGWVYLNRNVANLIMLVAALFSLRDIFYIYSEMQALNFAQFLIYLQIILLFQKKDGRTYWLLIMLSLLQVVVAALFSQGVFFGILLVLYMLMACLALALLMLNRQSELPRTKPQSLFSFGKQNKLETEPPADASGVKAAAKGGKGRSASRWALIGQQPVFEGAAAGSSRQGICAELFRRLIGMSSRTLALTMVLFIVVPRFGQVGWRGGFTQPKATVGFNNQVTLGELGQIIENPSEVMRIRFFDRNSDIPYAASGNIYLHGGFLMDYEKGRWKAGVSADSPLAGDEQLTKERLPKSYVVQQCDIEGLDHVELFFVPPFVAVETNNLITIDEKMGRLVRDSATRKYKFQYRLGTTAFINGIQSPLTPRKPPLMRGQANGEEKQEGSTEDRFAKGYSKDKNGEPVLKKLKKLADDWIAESKLPPEDVADRAHYIEHKLADSSVFKYSLKGPKRDESMDPIEDFLTVHREGHCEYFATALTLMLRHVGIPARMVVGFKCDEWHEAEQCYQVRQLHAHTWVQAYVKYDQLPKQWLHGKDFRWGWEKNGGWLRLDPTPSREDNSDKGFFAPVTKAMQWLDFAWSYYVVELNYERQRKAIFTPIAEAATKAFVTIIDPGTWRGIYERIGEALHRSGVAGFTAWLLLVVAVLAGLALLGLNSFITWRLGRKLWRIIAAKNAKHRLGPRIEVEFYRRLEHLLKKNGLSRPLGQTPREFAFVAGEWLAAETGEHRLLSLPGKVVEAYYHVRFGCLALDSCQTQEVEHILRDVELQIANRKLHAS